MRRRFLLTAILSAILFCFIVGGVVAAPNQGKGSDSFTTRVASILGVDVDDLQKAQKQAKEDLMKDRLDRAVNSGRIAQEEADSKLQWQLAAPKDRLQSVLDKAVAAGKLTQEQADKKLETFQAKHKGKIFHGKKQTNRRGHGKLSDA